MHADIYEMHLKYPGQTLVTPHLKPKEMSITTSYINKILGLTLKEADIKKYLQRMGYNYTKKALIPPYRTDILHPIDLVEDIAIAYGYEHMKPELPSFATIAEENSFEKFKNKLASLLPGLGLIEVNTFNLVNKEDQAKKMNLDISCIELENALNLEYNALRAWMIPSLLKVLQDNKHYNYPQKIYEIGTIFKHGKTETGIEEASRLAIILSHGKADFTEIKQIFDAIARSLNFTYSINDANHASFIPGRVGRISVKGKQLAFMGELHPAVIKNFDISMPVAALELNVTDLFDILR